MVYPIIVIAIGIKLKTNPVTLNFFLLQPINPKMQNIIPSAMQTIIITSIIVATTSMPPLGRLLPAPLTTDMEFNRIWNRQKHVFLQSVQ